MNYTAIYDRFITDRRAKEAALIETGCYVERHHIVPRSMHGTDDADNLVALTPEDHFFAHLLFAKARNTSRAWGAVRLMAGHLLGLSSRARRGLAPILALGRRRQYGAAKRWANARMSGSGHPMADRRIHRFRHQDGREFSGTQIEFRAFSGVSAASIGYLIAGGMTAYGWHLPVNNPSGRGGWDVSSEKQRDAEVRTYRHFDGREFEGSRQAAAIRIGVSVGQIGNMIHGKTQTTRGWQIIDGRKVVSPEFLRRDGSHNGRYDHTEYDWTNLDTGEVVRATKGDMWARYGGSRAHWTSAVTGARKSFLGWTTRPQDVRVRSNKGKRFVFVNRDGRTFEGTQVELCRSQGVSPTSGARMVRDKMVTRCGWRLAGTDDETRLAA